MIFLNFLSLRERTERKSAVYETKRNQRGKARHLMKVQGKYCWSNKYNTYRPLLLQKGEKVGDKYVLMHWFFYRFKAGIRSEEIIPKVLSSLILYEMLGVRCICSVTPQELTGNSVLSSGLYWVTRLSFHLSCESLWAHWVTAFLWVMVRSLDHLWCLWCGEGQGLQEGEAQQESWMEMGSSGWLWEWIRQVPSLCFKTWELWGVNINNLTSKSNTSEKLAKDSR